jgi:hypothetical protein
MVQTTDIISLTKFDAARRQLRTAIELFFADADPVSTHTLAMSAHQLLHDINRKKKGPTLILDTDTIKDEYRAEWVNTIKRPLNFFKHSDDRGKRKKDIIERLDFKPASNEFVILFSVLAINYLGEKFTDVEQAFWIWIIIQRRHLLTETGKNLIKQSAPFENIEAIRGMRKGDFFKTFLEIGRNYTGHIN